MLKMWQFISEMNIFVLKSGKILLFGVKFL